MALQWIPPSQAVIPAVQSGLTRASAKQINAVDVTAYRDLTLSGVGKPIPVGYGTFTTSGIYIAGPVKTTTTTMVFAIAWSEGPIGGVQELYSNDAAPTYNSNFAVTHYTGTEAEDGVVDPTLAAAIPGFLDSFDGVGYTVFKITTTGSPEVPNIRAVVQGRIILDPRTGVEAFTENPGLFIYDMVTNPRYGFGRSFSGTGIIDVIDRCDSLYLDEPRCRAGLLLGEAETEEDLMPILCTYAECLWSFAGAAIYIVADAAVDAPDVVLTKNDIIENTLSISANGYGRSPTVMVVEYLPRTGTATPWTADAAEQSLPEVYFGDLPEIESSIKLLGVYRQVEAERKNTLRLNRLRSPGVVNWTAPDTGVQFVKGDVVELPSMFGMVGQLVRVMDVQMAGLARYQISAEVYNAAAYGDELVSAYPDSPLYEGLILPYSGALPAGFDAYTAADGRVIIGADDDTVLIGATAGTTTAGPWSGSTSEDPLHPEGANLPGFDVHGSYIDIGLTPGAPEIRGYQALEPDLHDHDVTVAEFTPDLYRYEFKLMKKTGGDGDLLPLNVQLLGDAGLVAFGMSQVTDHNLRYVAAGNAGPAGVAAPLLSSAASMTVGGANHHHEAYDGVEINYVGPPRAARINLTTGPHVHAMSVPMEWNLDRLTVCLYGASQQIRLKRGMYAFWADALEDIPPGWYLCDGTNGTPDTIGRHLQIAGSSGDILGNNTIKVQGSVTPQKHGHRGGSTDEEYTITEGYHLDVYHDHTLDMEIPWLPPNCGLAIIKYLPEPN